MTRRLASVSAALCVIVSAAVASAQTAPPADEAALREGLETLEASLDDFRTGHAEASVELERRIADVAVLAKAVRWCLEHDEFVQPAYVKQAKDALELGRARLAELAMLPDERTAAASWETRPGKTVRGFVSKVDDSVQPYAITLPRDFDPADGKRWPLHLVLHGRQKTMNEVNFVSRHDGKEAPAEQIWIQLDVYGRGNNAYRWAGETDVFEALDDVQRRHRVDRNRITLWGFSMGGAGAWHLGLHHPSTWSSVGAGAGFVDFYEYQNVEEKLPSWQHATLGIYDARDYALNAFNVPVVGYGGELDKQLKAAKTMVAEAEKLGVSIKLLVGPQTEHEFHPESLEEFMAFHAEATAAGRPTFPGRREIRFTTRTVKYNTCEWLSIEELLRQYEPATVESKVNDSGDLEITTQNVGVLQIARDLADLVVVDGDVVPLRDAADGLLPGVYYEHNGRAWFPMTYEASKDFYTNGEGRKRHGVQGPIDDAFTGPFVCVRGTGEPWSKPHHDWANWTLARFEREWSKWMRGELVIVDDTAIPLEPPAEDAENPYAKNLVLFGDPGSNAVLAHVLKDLPVEWTEEKLVVDGVQYDPDTHGLSLVFPNPLDKRRYVVVNSGHTFHEKDFEASNAWLFPRLGDIAVQRFEKRGDGYVEETVWAEIMNGAWRLPPRRAAE